MNPQYLKPISINFIKEQVLLGLFTQNKYYAGKLEDGNTIRFKVIKSGFQIFKLLYDNRLKIITYQYKDKQWIKSTSYKQLEEGQYEISRLNQIM